MDIRDTVSKVLLGIAFGFVMGIVMYQASGIDASVVDKNILRAQENVCTPPCDPSFHCEFGGTAVEVCTPDGPAGCPVEDPSCCKQNGMGDSCPGADDNPNTICCATGLICQGSGLPNGAPTCVAPPISSSSSTPFCTAPQFQCMDVCCNPGDTCDALNFSCISPPPPPPPSLSSSSSSFSPSSSFSSSSAGLCCDTVTNSCVGIIASSSVASSSGGACGTAEGGPICGNVGTTDGAGCCENPAEICVMVNGVPNPSDGYYACQSAPPECAGLDFCSNSNRGGCCPSGQTCTELESGESVCTM